MSEVLKKYEAELREKLEARGFPPATVNAMAGYVVYGTPTGGFTRAIFENNLVGAYCRADANNRKLIPEYVASMVDDLPCACWGDEDMVKRWIRQKGLAKSVA